MILNKVFFNDLKSKKENHWRLSIFQNGSHYSMHKVDGACQIANLFLKSCIIFGWIIVNLINEFLKSLLTIYFNIFFYRSDDDSFSCHLLV